MSKIACVFGGTGFIGRYVVRELCKAGYRVKVVSRVPERAFDLKPNGAVGQVIAVPCDHSPAQIDAVIAGCDVVINLVGILFEKGKSRFQTVHVDFAQHIAQACRKNNVTRLVHISALGVDVSKSRYAQTKKKGEDAVLKAFPAATILRPSIVFGAEDQFFNRFAAIAAIAPALPLIGGGQTKFQPVYVGDVADAVMAALKDDAAKGKIYELGGPEVLSFKELYQRLFSFTKRPRPLVSLPFGIAKVQGVLLGVLPHPPLTADQVESLKYDNVVQRGAAGFKELGIAPTALDSILPTYLRRYKRGGRFADKKQA